MDFPEPEDEAVDPEGLDGLTTEWPESVPEGDLRVRSGDSWGEGGEDGEAAGGREMPGVRVMKLSSGWEFRLSCAMKPSTKSRCSRACSTHLAVYAESSMLPSEDIWASRSRPRARGGLSAEKGVGEGSDWLVGEVGPMAGGVMYSADCDIVVLTDTTELLRASRSSGDLGSMGERAPLPPPAPPLRDLGLRPRSGMSRLYTPPVISVEMLELLAVRAERAADFSAVMIAGPGNMCAFVREAQLAIRCVPPEYCVCTVFPMSPNLRSSKRRNFFRVAISVRPFMVLSPKSETMSACVLRTQMLSPHSSATSNSSAVVFTSADRQRLVRFEAIRRKR